MKVDTILAHAIVLTMDDDYTLISDGALAIAGEKIVAVGEASEILDQYESEDVIDCNHCVVMPGFVNAHTHVPMALLRGLADDLRLDVWLMGYIMPVEREFVDPDFVATGTLLGCAEMIQSGVTTFCDMYYFEDKVAQVTADVGMRGVLGQTVLIFPSPDAQSYEDSIESGRKFIEKWKGHPLIVPAIAPHAHYTCPPEVLSACVDLAMEYNVPLHTHVSETIREVEESRKQHGMPVVPWIKKNGLLETKLIAAHCVHIDSGEIRTLQRAGAGVAHNPSSNLKLASGVAPVAQMTEAGLKLGLGTDGCASNNYLDMFEEMRLASFIAKGTSGDPLAVPAREAVMLATIGGARAIHLDHLIGSLVPGKCADVIVVDMQALHNTPRFKRDVSAAYSQLVYSSKASDVRDVWCNGRAIMRDRKVLTIDVAAVMQEAQEIAAKIDTFLLAREGNILDKLLTIGGIAQEETYEVQVKIPVADAQLVKLGLQKSEITVERSSVRNQYDSYFIFADPQQGRVRYREDEILDESSEPKEVRYSLTLTGPVKEREFANSILLSRSRFTAHAERSRRFYREYFHPIEERKVHKKRERWHIFYKDVEFALNLDRLTLPERAGYFVEIKSRTWSPSDAERKVDLIHEILDLFDLHAQRVTRSEYVDF